MTFWRVELPPPPSSMLATNTVLSCPPRAPRGEPVICTSRMKVAVLLTTTGPVHVTPSSE